MKLLSALITSVFTIFLLHPGFAQSCNPNRYVDPVFTNVDKTSNIIFGTAPSVTNPYVAENVTYSKDLELDVFEPAGDTISRRPAIILMFGGGYILGGKDDDDIQLACDSLARRGYVTVSAEYRLGLNVMSTTSAERAVYRGVQDMSAAVRFLKEYRTTYRIDTNFIFIGGVSAGAINSLHLAFAEESDRPASTYASGGLLPAPDLGCSDCSGNNFNHSSQVKAVINCWGAIGDLSWIDPGENIPIASFHGDADLIIPYDSGYPYSALATMPYVYGSNSITTRANNVGLYNEMNTFPGEGHNIWGTVANNTFIVGPTQHFGPIIRSISNFLFSFLKPPAISVTGNNVLCQGDTATYSTPITTGSWYCWSVNGGTIISSDPFASSIDIRWDNAGTHDIQVVEQNYFQASGDTVMYSVLVNPSPPVNAGTDQEICQGDSVSIAGSGASIYQWLPEEVVVNHQTSNTIAFPSQTTQLVLIGTDTNGCTNTDSILIHVNLIPTINAGPDQNICNGDSAYLNGAGGANYQWMPDSIVLNNQNPSTIAFPSQITTLTLLGTDTNGCTHTDTMTIVVHELPPQPMIWETTDTLFTENGFMYQWHFNGSLLIGEDQSFITNLQGGIYHVDVVDTNGCSNSSSEYNYAENPSGIIQYPDLKFTLSPNPGSGQYALRGSWIEKGYAVDDIMIYNSLGHRVVHNLEIHGGEILIDLSNVKSGLYTIKFRVGQKVYFKTLVKY